MYRVLFKFLEDNKTDKEKVEEILGKEIFDNFKKYKTCYGWIIQLITLKEKALLQNEILVIKGYFLGSMKDMTIFRI